MSDATGTPSGASTDPVTLELDQLTVVVDPTVPSIALVGELDPHTAPVLQRAIDDVLGAGDGPATLVLDLSGLGFVDSSGLRVLIGAQNQLAAQGGTLTLHDPSPTVRRLLEITGLIDHIAITER